MNQTKDDVCVLNMEDEELYRFGSECPAKVVWFSSKRKPEIGAYVQGDDIRYTDGTTDELMLNVHDMNLLGTHNYENVCAAIAMTKAAGIPDDIIVQQVKKLVLIGQTANKIAQTCDKYGFKDYVFANDLKEVVDICAASADKGDAVLLSPACASWGMFDNYEQRGDMFKQYVNEL